MKVIRTVTCVCTLILVGWAVSWGQKGPEKLIVGGNYDYPPYEFVDENGVPSGYATDLTKALSEVMGMEVQITLDSWNKSRKRLETGEINAIHGMYYSPERDKLVDFSPPHTIIYNTIFSRKELPEMKSLDSLKGKKIVVVQKGALHDYLVANGFSKEIVPVESEGRALRLISSGEYDYALLGKLPGMYLKKKLKLSNIRVAGPSILPFKYCFAVKEGDSYLLSRINEGLAILKQTGQYQEIYDKWLGVFEPREAWADWILRFLLVFGVAAGVIMAVAFFWVKTLKKKVVERTSELKKEIDDHKRSEEALKASEKKYRLLTENMKDVVWVLDVESMFFRYVSPSVERLRGYTPDEIIAVPMNQALTPEAASQLMDPIHSRVKAFQTGKATSDTFYTDQVEQPCKDGSTVWTEVITNCYVNPENNKIEVLGVTRDITDRKQSEKALQEALQFKDMIISESPIGIAIYDGVSGQCLASNDSIAKLVGATKEKLLAQNFREINSWKESGLLQAAMTSLENHENKLHTAKVKTTFGKELVIDCNFAPLFFGDKRYLLLMASDVTKQKEAEEALKKSEEEYRNVFDNAPIMYVITENRKGLPIIKDVNEEFVEVLGHPREEIIGNSLAAYYTPDSASKMMEGGGYKKALDGLFTETERSFITRKGQIIDTLVQTVPIKDKTGKATGVRSTFLDITDRKKAESEKKLLEAQLRQSQKLESIGNLAGGIAHDFNNILSSVIGFTELSLDDVERGSDMEGNLQEVLTAGKRAKDLVKQILTFARQSDEELKPIPVDNILKEVLNFLRSSIPASVEIKRNIKSDSLIMGNSTQVHQVLMNLCINASQAMEGEGGILGVSLKDIQIERTSSIPELHLKPGNYIKIAVSDTGAGIPPKIIRSIFDPYFTTKEPGEGTGMGLATAHGIVETYGGKITVDSTLGKGTLFTIYLPVIKKRKEHRPYQSEELPTGTERILFVDDEASIANMGSQILSRLGYSVSTRTSSVEALELFRSKPEEFDLVITDMTMPNMTGDQLTVKLLEIRPDIPVILCTGYSKKISDESAIDMGIKAFVYKPVVKADLAKTVRDVLNKRNNSAKK